MNTFFQTFGPFTAKENESANATVGKVFAEDKDIGNNAKITYSIIGEKIALGKCALTLRTLRLYALFVFFTNVHLFPLHGISYSINLFDLFFIL